MRSGTGDSVRYFPPALERKPQTLSFEFPGLIVGLQRSKTKGYTCVQQFPKHFGG